MEVSRTFVVNHKNGLTVMYLLKDGRYVLTVPCFVSTGTWMDILEFIDEEKALSYLDNLKDIEDEK